MDYLFTIDDSVSNKTVDSVERKKPPIQTITSDEDSDTEYDSETGKNIGQELAL